MPVDVEPEVFWAGDPDGGAARLSEWKTAVEFVDGDGPGAHGAVRAVDGAPMGKVLNVRCLDCMGVRAEQCAFTDVHPVYMAKRKGKLGRGRHDGDAIDQDYNSVAARLNRNISHVPRRPSPGRLVKEAVSRFADRVVADLKGAHGPMVITAARTSSPASSHSCHR